MIKELTTVYISKTETHEYGLFFTQEEYNKHIEEVIKDALEIAAENATLYISEQDERYDDVDRKSITNTLEQSYNKWKIN